MKLPINLTPAKALEILRAYFTKADGYHVTIDCCVDSYNWRDEIGTCFSIHAWQEGKTHITGGGPTLGTALRQILEDREPVKLFTEDPEAVQFFKSAEDDAEALRLSALSAGAKVEEGEERRTRYFKQVRSLWRFRHNEDAQIGFASNPPEWERSFCKPSDFHPSEEITEAEALALTGGAL